MRQHTQQARINRYIVGCKYADYWKAGSTDSELIDTQWDVNEYANKLINIINGINRYIVGCK